MGSAQEFSGFIRFVTNPVERLTEVHVDEVLDGEVLEKIYEKWDGPSEDYGGGVRTILAYDVLKDCEESPYKFSRKYGVTQKEAKEVIASLQNKVRSEEVR